MKKNARRLLLMLALIGPAVISGCLFSSQDSKDWLAEGWTAQELGEGSLNNIMWKESLYVATVWDGVSTTGAVTSPDGDVWTNDISGVIENPSIAWTGVRFVRVDRFGFIHTSPDGINWDIAISGTPWEEDLNSPWFSSVAWNGSQLVVVGEVIATTPDGLTWTLRSSEFDFLSHVTWTGSQFVAVGNLGTILTSPNGVTWVERNSSITRNLRGGAFSGGVFIAVGDTGTILTSIDGGDWVRSTSGVEVNLNSVVWGEGLAVAVGDSGTTLTSDDGITWTPRLPGTGLNFHSVEWKDSQFVASGNSYVTYTSPDGVSWTKGSSDVPQWWKAAWTDSLYVAPGLLSPTILTSTDGDNWIPAKHPVRPGYGSYHSVFWTGERVVVVGGGQVLTSQDGVDWTERQAAVVPNAVVWTGEQLIGIGGGNQVRAVTSPDGVNWTTTYNFPIGFSETVISHELTWTGELAVATWNSEHRYIATSNDGNIWTMQEVDPEIPVSALSWTGSEILLFRQDGTFLTSTNGISWVKKEYGSASYKILDVLWDKNRLLAVGFRRMPDKTWRQVVLTWEP